MPDNKHSFGHISGDALSLGRRGYDLRRLTDSSVKRLHNLLSDEAVEKRVEFGSDLRGVTVYFWVPRQPKGFAPVGSRMVATKDLEPGDVVRFKNGELWRIVTIGEPERGPASRLRRATIESADGTAMAYSFSGHDSTTREIIAGPRFSR